MPKSVCSRIYTVILWLFLCLTVAVGVSVAVMGKNSKSVSLLPSLAESYNNDWYYYDENGESVKITLPAVVPCYNGTSSRIYMRHTSYKPKKLCFYTCHQSARVYLNGVVLYEYDEDKKPSWLSSYRGFYHIVSLPAIKEGELSLELNALIPKYGGEFRGMFIGDHGAILFRIILSRFYRLVLGGVLVIFSIIVLLMSTLYNPSRGVDRTLVHLGLLVLFTGIWQMESSDVLQFFVGTQGVHWILEYLILYFILAASLAFINDITQRSQWLSTLIFNSFCLVMSSVLLLLQIFGMFQLANSTFLLKHLLIACCFYVSYMVKKNGMFKKHSIEIVFTAFVIASGFLFLLALTGIIFKHFVDVLLCIAFSLMFLSLFLLVYHMTFEKFEALRNAELYHKLAFVDFNTGVSSKTAWFSLVERFDPQKDRMINCCLILFDMNNLKKLNDTKGHLFGDKVINEFCRCMSEAFGDDGTIFRIGGDEFICLCRHSSEDEVMKMLDRFDYLSSHPENPEYAFSCAYGYVFFTPRKKQDFIEAQQRADALMYDKKRKMKAVL